MYKRIGWTLRSYQVTEVRAATLNPENYDQLIVKIVYLSLPPFQTISLELITEPIQVHALHSSVNRIMTYE